MASTPTSQIARVVTSSVSNSANVSANARFQYSSSLTQGPTQGSQTPQFLQVEKSMQIHSQSGQTSN